MPHASPAFRLINKHNPDEAYELAKGYLFSDNQHAIKPAARTLAERAEGIQFVADNLHRLPTSVQSVVTQELLHSDDPGTSNHIDYGKELEDRQKALELCKGNGADTARVCHSVHYWCENLLHYREIVHKQSHSDEEVCESVREYQKRQRKQAQSIDVQAVTDLDEAAWARLKLCIDAFRANRIESGAIPSTAH